ncbi:MAG: endonuclease/exonuclease/phosphatase family protein [Acidimicrobiia bacterium]
MRKTVVATALCALLLLVSAPPAAAAGDGDGVRIVNLNLLHGVFCPAETDGCLAPDRVDLLMRQLEDADCPEVVGLQEINAVLAKLLAKAVPKTCDGDYEIVPSGKPTTLDTERVLTTLPITSTKVEKLVGGFRTATRVVMKSSIGPLVLVVTHQEGDPEGKPPGPPCRNCPPPCKEQQAPIFVCQTVAAAALADDAGGSKAVRVLMGDFNVTPASARYQGLIAAGWVDTYTLAGNAECDASTSEGCTAGRDDKTLESLQDPTKRQAERIDFIFVKSPASCEQPQTDTASDDDGVGTGLWNDEPTVDGPGGLAWTSDHTGVSADISCGK